METDEQLTVSKVTVRLAENGEPLSVSPNFRVRFSHEQQQQGRINQVAIVQDALLLRGQREEVASSLAAIRSEVG